MTTTTRSRLRRCRGTRRRPGPPPKGTRGLPPLASKPLAFDKPLCVSLDGFTLHAATRAGGADAEGREALLRYVLRPPLAQERVVLREDSVSCASP